MSTFSMKTRVCRHLDKYVSDRVWSDPYLESRITTRPCILNPCVATRESSDPAGTIPVESETRWSPYTPLSGVLYGDFEQIDLPKEGSFYVYSVDLEQIRSIKLNATSWTSLADYCTGSVDDNLPARIVSFRVYADKGECIPMSKCYIRQAPGVKTILLAVDADIFHKCCDGWTQVVTADAEGVHMSVERTEVANPTGIFLTTYVDSDVHSAGEVRETYIPDNKVTTQILTADDITKLRSPVTKLNPVAHGDAVHDLTFLNGHFLNADYESSYTGALAEGDIIEYIDDADIVATLRYDRASVPKYQTESDGEYALVHMPLSLNPSKYLISYLPCDVYVIPKIINEDKQKASYRPGTMGFHAYITERQTATSPLFKQLTFNDFGISLNKLDEYAREVGTEVDSESGILSYSIFVVVRHHNKKLGIVRDANYCDLLYDASHTDEDIVNLLTADVDKYSDDMWFWTAKYLHEHSAYGDAMNRKIMALWNPATQCDECAISKECTIKAEATGGKVTGRYCQCYTKLGINEYVNILGYYNVLHLIAKRITTYKVTNMRKVTTWVDAADIDEQSKANPGGPITHEVVTNTINRVIPVQTPVVFADRDLSTFKPVVYLNGIKLSEDLVTIKGYGAGNTDGLIPIHYTYTPRYNEVNWTGDNKWIDIKIDDSVKIKVDDYICVELIAVDTDEAIYEGTKTFDIYQGVFTPIGAKSSAVTGTVQTGATGAPHVPANVYFPVTKTGGDVVYQNHDQVYLNGKHLVEGIDYAPFSLRKTSFQPVVQNVSYLKNKDNFLDVITTPDKNVGSVKGFVVGDWILWPDISNIWFDDLSLLIVDGKVQNRFTYQYRGFDMSEAGIRNGSPYMVRTCVAAKAMDLLDTECADVDGYTAKQIDNMKLTLLTDYFSEHVAEVPYRAVIPYEHKIYSIYLLAIIKDYLNGSLTIAMKPTKEEFVAQFSSYESLKRLDVVYTHAATSEYFLKFLDVYPIYYNAQVNSIEKRRMINYMVQMLLPADAMRHRKHIYG